MFPKTDLFRIDVSKDGNVSFDKTNSLKGRGYYIHKDIDTLKKAKDKNIINKVLCLDVDQSIYDEMMKLL